MNKIKPYCEPILLPVGNLFNVNSVEYVEGQDHQCFYHFHEVCELILFKQVDGDLITQDNYYPLSDKSLVFLPSMAVHQFKLTASVKSWKMVLFSPLIFSLLGLTIEEPSMNNPIILKLTEHQYKKFELLLSWLEENNKLEDEINYDLIRLMIRKLNQLLNKEGNYQNHKTKSNDKIMPFLNAIIKGQTTNLSLTEAAKLCQLSPSYFSRYFKSIFHQNYSQYMLIYRLHLASHYLKNTDHSISTIGYDLDFSHPSYFITRFKQYFGVTPKQYRLR